MKEEMNGQVQTALNVLKRHYDEVLRYENEKNKLLKLKESDFPEFPIDVWGGVKGVTEIRIDKVYEPSMWDGLPHESFKTYPLEETEVLLPPLKDKTESDLLLDCLINIFDRELSIATKRKEDARKELEEMNVDYKVTVNYADTDDDEIYKHGLKNGFCNKYCVVTYKGRKETKGEQDK